MIRGFWYQSDNVGDKLTPYLIRKIFDDEPELSDIPPRWFMGGSVGHYLKNGDIVCGVGTFEGTSFAPCVEAIAVRGPMTAQSLNLSCLFGDAGLLLPHFYQPPKRERKGLGIVPHYVDYDWCRYNGLQNIVDVRQDVEQFIDDVTQYAIIASSSLHGIVIAEAYGIPVVRVRFPTSSRIASFDYKHLDYYLGTERDMPAAMSIDDVVAKRYDLPPVEPVRYTSERVYEALMQYLERRA